MTNTKLSNSSVRKTYSMVPNKDQREGLAKVTDNLGTACAAASLAGGLVDRKIGWYTILALLLIAIIFIYMGVRLRQQGDEDGH